MKKLSMVIMSTAIALAFTACGNKAADASANEEAKDSVEAAAEPVAEAKTETEQLKEDMQEILDQIRAAKTMAELEAVGKDLDPKIRDLGQKINGNPELEKFVESLGDDFNLDKVMEKKMEELLKK